MLIPILVFLYVIIVFMSMPVWITAILIAANTHFFVKNIYYVYNMYFGMKISEDDYNEAIENLKK